MLYRVVGCDGRRSTLELTSAQVEDDNCLCWFVEQVSRLICTVRYRDRLVAGCEVRENKDGSLALVHPDNNRVVVRLYPVKD